MVQTIAVDKLTLYDLEHRFGLKQTNNPSFFLEWQEDLPTLTADEQQRLARVQAIVANLEQRSVLENTVKLSSRCTLIGSIRFLPAAVLRQHRRLRRNRSQ